MKVSSSSPSMKIPSQMEENVRCPQKPQPRQCRQCRHLHIRRLQKLYEHLLWESLRSHTFPIQSAHRFTLRTVHIFILFSLTTGYVDVDDNSRVIIYTSKVMVKIRLDLSVVICFLEQFSLFRTLFNCIDEHYLEKQTSGSFVCNISFLNMSVNSINLTTLYSCLDSNFLSQKMHTKTHTRTHLKITSKTSKTKTKTKIKNFSHEIILNNSEYIARTFCQLSITFRGLNILLLRSGDIETNPGPNMDIVLLSQNCRGLNNI